MCWGGDSVPETSLHLHMTDGSKQSRRLGEKGRESYFGINKADRSVIRSSLVSGRSSHRPLPTSLHPSIPPSSSVPLSQDGRETHRRRCVMPTKQNKCAGTRRALRHREKWGPLNNARVVFPKFESVFSDS